MMVLYGSIWTVILIIVSGLTIKFLFPRYAKLSEKKPTSEEDAAEGAQNAEAVVEELPDGEAAAEETGNEAAPAEAPAEGATPAGETLRSVLADKGLTALIILSLLFAAACGAMIWWFQVEAISACTLLVTFCALYAAALTDYKYFKIPNLCAVLMLAARVVLSVAEIVVYGWDAFAVGILECVITAIVGMLFLLAASKLTRGGIGYGDIKLLGAVAFLCGLRAFIYSLLLGMIVCALFAIALLILKKKKMKDELPLAPFIFVGFAVSILLGIA